MTKDPSLRFHREINQHKLAIILSTLIDNIFVKNPEHVKISGNLISDVSDHSSQLPGGQCWKVVQYASRSLADLEKWYSHIVSETLASDFGCNKFHLFLYGRPFKIVRHSEPLESVREGTGSLFPQNSAWTFADQWRVVTSPSYSTLSMPDTQWLNSRSPRARKQEYR